MLETTVRVTRTNHIESTYQYSMHIVSLKAILTFTTVYLNVFEVIMIEQSFGENNVALMVTLDFERMQNTYGII